MARRFSRAQLSHTQTDPRRGSVSSIQVSGGSATLVPHIEQLVPVESGAVICSTIVAVPAMRANAKAPGPNSCRNPGPFFPVTREVSPHLNYRCEMAALAARRASRARLICRELSASRWISRIRSRARSSINELMSCLHGMAAPVAPRGKWLSLLVFR